MKKYRRIKQINQEDLYTTYQVSKKYTDERHSFDYWKKKYKKTPELFVACYDDNRIIGICIGKIRKNKIILSSIAVHIKFQKQGIGKKLLKYFESKCKKIGKTIISVGSAKNVVKFYTKAGYKPVQKSKHFQKYILMEKKLNSVI